MPVAFVGRTSTLGLQDPVRRCAAQLRSCQDWLPQGWFIAAVFWDVESGGTDLDARGRGDVWQVLTAAGLPRDGGMADLLTRGGQPAPRFAAVICENIERSGRDMFDALRLEKQLPAQGIPLFATDEPTDIAGPERHHHPGAPDEAGRGRVVPLPAQGKDVGRAAEHSLDGCNIGPAPYGYAADRTRTPTRSRPPRAAPRPGWSSTRSPRPRGGDLHLADGGQAGAAGHRRPG